MRKITSVGLLAVGLLFFANEGFAEGGKGRWGTWEVAPEVYWFFYEEPSLSVEWEGWMYGVKGSLTSHSQANPFSSRMEGRYAIGNVDYDGSLTDGTPHTTSGTDQTAEVAGTVGYDISGGRDLAILYAGAGFRYWFDDLDSSSSYARRVRYLYSPIGLEMTQVNQTWRVGFRAEYDIFWRGWVTSQLSDVNPSLSDVSNRQDGGYGVRGSVYFQRRLNRNTSLSIEPFIRYWDIDASDKAPITFAGILIGSGQEPANRTIESGLQISLVF